MGCEDRLDSDDETDTVFVLDLVNERNRCILDCIGCKEALEWIYTWLKGWICDQQWTSIKMSGAGFT